MEEGRQQKGRPPREKGARESCNRNLGHSNSQRRICRKAQKRNVDLRRIKKVYRAGWIFIKASKSKIYYYRKVLKA